jgi:hypothetical protein
LNAASSCLAGKDKWATIVPLVSGYLQSLIHLAHQVCPAKTIADLKDLTTLVTALICEHW